MPIDQQFWHRQPAIDAALASHFANFIGPDKLVVDVGAGYDPWPHATEFVEYDEWPNLAGKTVRRVDVENEPLPYADKSIDFIYCRHTIEDLDHPALLLREMNRVAKAGYLETPSPMVELCRGVAGELRGYFHHRWFVWANHGTLMLLPKFSAVERLEFSSDYDIRLVALLNNTPACWNTYFPWTGGFTFRVLKQHRDFAPTRYHEQINAAVGSVYANAGEFVRTFGLEAAHFAVSPHDRQEHSG
jgi:hypothetical protein